MLNDPVQTLLTFIGRLLDGQRRLDAGNPLLLSLILARGLLLRQEAALQGRHLNHQTLVLGPTQAGKSTLVNLLLGGNHAEASPLAGFTRHAQGFGPALSLEQAGLLRQLLPGFTQVPRAELDPEAVEDYSLSQIESSTRGILWDTPDFDSINARHYRFSLPAFCALADQLILVVSKEKYADQSVWEMLRLLVATNIPLILVINKVPEAEAEALQAIIAKRFATEKLPCPEIFSLPWLNPADPDQLAASTQGQRLLDWHRCSGQISLAPAGLGHFLQLHWPDWTQALRLELANAEAWRGHIERLSLELGQHFRRDYLQNQTYEETRARVLVEFLQLLEVPGLGKALAEARNLVTWPARRLVRLFTQDQPQQTGGDSRNQNSEFHILREATGQLLQQLLSQAMTEAGQRQGLERNWWQQLWQLLARKEQRLARMASGHIERHQSGFQQQIRATADELLVHLRQDPLRLNSLRTARLTTDAVAIAIPFATGTTGLMDVAMSPVMLAFSSFLAEGALGQYLNSELEQLKEQQLASVKTEVLRPLQQQLEALVQQIAEDCALGLSAAELEQARAALEALRP